ncbi:YihY/virulence factor BrkB family protein [Phenylobacterium sp.]|uniref:YihY/virulence factor BrkB family protein n=1 Tax=Phenylobacterium sp. TaxID=1871053 RepID=UPI003523F952
MRRDATFSTFRAMSIRREFQRLRQMDWDPTHWLRLALLISGKALTRLWGRDVMLYVGGVSFFVMLAVFPALAITIGVYGLLADPTAAAHQAELMATMMPAGAQTLFTSELTRLAQAPFQVVSTQSGVALVIGGYAAHRGFKALLAGLSFIHDEDAPRGFVGFNVMALIVLVAAFAMLAFFSAVFFYFRFVAAAFDLKPLAGVTWLYSEWTWASVGLTVAMSLIYRFAMSSAPVAWRASIIGGIAAAFLCLFASWASAIYVEQIAELGATYGSVAAVVVFLIWLSWNVNAVFLGGALATEIEILLYERRPMKLLLDQRHS